MCTAVKKDTFKKNNKFFATHFPTTKSVYLLKLLWNIGGSQKRDYKRTNYQNDFYKTDRKKFLFPKLTMFKQNFSSNHIFH